ncbi:MAG: glycosyltransferase family 4 protein [Candidatus Methylomirabilis sp.]
MGYLRPLAEPFLLAFAGSLLLTPLLRRFALRIGFVDLPTARKIHREPVALLGGVAVYLAFAAAVISQGAARGPLLGVLLGAAFLMLVGIVDDAQGMDPRIKLLAQAGAAIMAVMFGIQTTFLGVAYLNIPFTVLWIVGITNAFNLLDNMDGLAAGVTVISASTFAVLASRYSDLGGEQVATAIAAAALAGGCLGFLRFNIVRASIFMGDAGSMVLGFILASLAALGSWRSPTVPTSLLIPILVLAYPIFDTTFVALLRVQEGRPVFQGGKDHSSHRLVSLGLGQTEAVFLIYLFALCHALTATLVTSVTLRLSLLALASSAFILFIFGAVLRKAKV